MKTNQTSNGAALEAAPVENQSLTQSGTIRYLEGRPKQYRADAKSGNFNINGGTPAGDTLSFTPLAWRFFEDDILQMGRKKWVEIFFVDERHCLSAILFHGYSRDHLEKLAQDLFYEDVTMADIVITAKFSQKKNEKIKPAATYHIAEFEVSEVLDKAQVDALQQFAHTNRIYRLETLTETCQMQAFHNFYVPESIKEIIR